MYIAVSVKKLGDIDIVVANVSALTVQDEVASWQKAFDVDMMHTVRAVNAAMPCLEKSKHGPVLTVSSVSGSEVDFLAMPMACLKQNWCIRRSLWPTSMREGQYVFSVSLGNTYFDGGVWRMTEKTCQTCSRPPCR